MDRLAPQDCEGDARHLVGERHGDELEGWPNIWNRTLRLIPGFAARQV
jgi:hypothetical protein